MKKLIALLLALCMVLAMGACAKKETPEEAPAEKPSEEQETPADTTETPETPAEPEKPAEEPAEDPADEPAEELPGVAGESGGGWYEAEREHGEFTDGVGNENTYDYAVPAFNVDSADASRLNGEIADFCQTYIDSIKQAETDATSLWVYNVGYEAYQSGDVISIVVKAEMDNDVIEYRTFNLNAATGAEATGADLIALAGLDEQTFIDKAQQAASAKFEEKYGAMQGDAFYQEQYDKTMSADAFSLNTMMYLDGSGVLHVIVPIYSMAGADCYYEPLTIA